MSIRRLLLAAFLLFSSPVIGQETTKLAAGAVLRSLDRVGGLSNDHILQQGETLKIGTLMVIVGECRYPLANPSGDAFTYLTVTNEEGSKDFFRGWMIASSPALNALDHVRYDVWPLRCKMSEAVLE
tara:strand:+ start:326 stop:706 length:381 start_codon:yes stop_codon:yes gene_type:complete